MKIFNLSKSTLQLTTLVTCLFFKNKFTYGEAPCNRITNGRVIVLSLKNDKYKQIVFLSFCSFLRTQVKFISSPGTFCCKDPFF